MIIRIPLSIRRVWAYSATWDEVLPLRRYFVIAVAKQWPAMPNMREYRVRVGVAYA